MSDFARALECAVLDRGASRTRDNGKRSNGPAAQAASDRQRDANGNGSGWFSPRELEVLLEVENGISNKEIGRALGMTEHTVKFHLKNIYRKLRVGRRTQALRVARELRLI